MKTSPIILGTAGHIDHGKTTLVKALTGIDTDRLKEEKRRGITIELGFAHLDLGEQRFGLVDVPGHERFIKSMVAGAGGMDVVMLVIAADEGVMPQTREHLDVCQLLGIRRGVVALTKSDLVEPAWLDMVTGDVRAALKGTFLQDADVIPVSSTSGQGLDGLRAVLLALANDVAARPADGLFRMPLDRVFTLKGFGTVVTGTVLGGRVAAGEDVAPLPHRKVGKVRSVQVHGEDAPDARAGMRCAINITGIDRDELARGQILSHPDHVEPSHLIDATVRYLSTSKHPLKRRTHALVHHGTAQIMATVILVGQDSLAPGESGLVQLRLETPVAALPGDRYILRGFTPQEHYGTTLGGGEVVRVKAPKVRRSQKSGALSLAEFAGAEPALRIALEVKGAGSKGMSRKELSTRLGLLPADIDSGLNRLVQTRDLLRADTLYLHAEPLSHIESQLLAAVDTFHKQTPHKVGIPKEQLRSQVPRALPAKLFDAVLKSMTPDLADEGDAVRRQKHKPKQAAGHTSALADSVHKRFTAWGLSPPKPTAVHEAIQAEQKAVASALDLLLRDGKLVRVKADYFVDADALAALRKKLDAHLAGEGQISPQQWKTLTGLSRKYSIPLAEHFDAEKLTLRVGDVRKRRG